MADVAAQAGVSQQTVSRVLNQSPAVSPSTRARVLAAIDRLGYHPNRVARALATHRSGILGVVTESTVYFGPTSTLHGIEVAAREAGYYMSVSMLPELTPVAMRRALDHLLSLAVEGIVVIAPVVELAHEVSSFEAPVPVVAATSGRLSARPGLVPVGVDQEAGARLAVRHLIRLGRSEIVHVSGPQDWFDAQARQRAWADELARIGVIAPAPIQADWEASSGYRIGVGLAREGAPRAVFAANDEVALGLLRAFGEAGVRVPGDVAVVGFDDEPSSGYFLPPLTTVRQDFFTLGRTIVATLLAQIAGEEPHPVLLPTSLIVRASSSAH